MAAGNSGDVRPVGDCGPSYRVHFVVVDRELAVLLPGGDKSTQRRDIRRARSLAQELVTGEN